MPIKLPQTPMLTGGNEPFYPLTHASQVIKADGSRLEQDGRINADKATTADKLGGKAPEYYIRPRNLLDNSNFIIVQAGRNGNHGSAKYVCDRWISWDKDAAFGNGYMTPGSPIDQRIDPAKIDTNATYTVAIGLADGSVICYTANGGGEAGLYATVHYSWNGGTPRVRIGTGQNVAWAALYKGSYTADTLPPYIARGYAAELAECQRYFERIGWAKLGLYYSSILLAIDNKGSFRVLQGYKQTKRLASPTILVNGKSLGQTVSARNSTNDQWATGTLETWNNIFPERLNMLTLSGATSTIGYTYEAYIDICADL